MKTNHKKLMFTLVGALSLTAAFADASPDYCTEWKTAPATTACKGEGGTLAAGSYVKNGNGLWQCRDGEKDQWGHTVTWVADKAQLDTDCYVNSADARPDYCAEWKTAPATTACKGEGGTLDAGSYVKNGNGLWQCRDGEKDQWGHTVTWVADKAQLDTDCFELDGITEQECADTCFDNTDCEAYLFTEASESELNLAMCSDETNGQFKHILGLFDGSPESSSEADYYRMLILGTDAIVNPTEQQILDYLIEEGVCPKGSILVGSEVVNSNKIGSCRVAQPSHVGAKAKPLTRGVSTLSGYDETTYTVGNDFVLGSDRWVTRPEPEMLSHPRSIPNFKLNKSFLPAPDGSTVYLRPSGQSSSDTSYIRPSAVTMGWRNHNVVPTLQSYSSEWDEGRVTQNENGVACMKWSDIERTFPQKYTRMNNHYENTYGRTLPDHNYCRNPDGEPRSWCYNEGGQVGSNGKTWAFCDDGTSRDAAEITDDAPGEAFVIEYVDSNRRTNMKWGDKVRLKTQCTLNQDELNGEDPRVLENLRTTTIAGNAGDDCGDGFEYVDDGQGSASKLGRKWLCARYKPLSHFDGHSSYKNPNGVWEHAYTPIQKVEIMLHTNNKDGQHANACGHAKLQVTDSTGGGTDIMDGEGGKYEYLCYSRQSKVNFQYGATSGISEILAASGNNEYLSSTIGRAYKTQRSARFTVSTTSALVCPDSQYVTLNAYGTGLTFSSVKSTANVWTVGPNHWDVHQEGKATRGHMEINFYQKRGESYVYMNPKGDTPTTVTVNDAKGVNNHLFQIAFTDGFGQSFDPEKLKDLTELRTETFNVMTKFENMRVKTHDLITQLKKAQQFNEDLEAVQHDWETLDSTLTLLKGIHPIVRKVASKVDKVASKLRFPIDAASTAAGQVDGAAEILIPALDATMTWLDHAAEATSSGGSAVGIASDIRQGYAVSDNVCGRLFARDEMKGLNSALKDRLKELNAVLSTPESVNDPAAVKTVLEALNALDKFVNGKEMNAAMDAVQDVKDTTESIVKPVRVIKEIFDNKVTRSIVAVTSFLRNIIPGLAEVENAIASLVDDIIDPLIEALMSEVPRPDQDIQQVVNTLNKHKEVFLACDTDKFVEQPKLSTLSTMKKNGTKKYPKWNSFSKKKKAVTLAKERAIWEMKGCSSKKDGTIDGKWAKKSMKDMMKAAAPRVFLETEKASSAAKDAATIMQAELDKTKADAQQTVKDFFGTCFPQDTDQDQCLNEPNKGLSPRLTAGGFFFILAPVN